MTQFINFNTIIGNGKSYQVPIYQRDYSWTKDDWEDLWSDIQEIPNDKIHYMGYLVLQPSSEENQTYWIIDGQQRITTLSILCLAVISLLKKWSEDGIDSDDNKIRSEKLFERYLGNFSTSKLTSSPKLKLNRNNDDFYKSWLLNFRQPPAPSKLKPSQKLLQKAFAYFRERLSEKFSANRSGAELSEFLEKIAGNGLVFTEIVVHNDLDAFKVFETLNARGVKLSTADLLKNYLFSQAAKKGQLEVDEAEIRWQNIADTLKTNDITTFIRHYWNSRNNLERQPTLFKAIKRNIQDADSAFTLLDSLERNVTFYSAFNNPNDEIWDKEERKHLKVINLLEVSTCYSLMLSALEFLPRNDFKTLIRELASITFRYNISGLNPNEAERAFGKVAVNIAKSGTIAKDQVDKAGLNWNDVVNKLTGNAWAKAISSTEMRLDVDLDIAKNSILKVFGDNFLNILPILQQSQNVQTVREVIFQLKGIYVFDDNFEQAFSTTVLSTKRNKDLIKYVLVKIENHLSGTDNQFEDATSTIEHILPENPGSIWEDNFKPDEQLDYIFRIGNYTLLEASKNNKLDSNKSFTEKLAIYKDSKYKMTKDHLSYDNWTPDTLLLHQQQMAKWAKAIWKSGFL